MLVTQINATDYQGGAGRAAYRLHRAMLEAGATSYLVCRHQKKNETGIIRTIERSDEKGSGLDAQRRLERAYLQSDRIDSRRSPLSSTIFGLPYPGLDIAELPVVARADILHMHWINGFLSPITIAHLGATRAAVVWTLHDEWPFTGGCHYTAGCRKFTQGCDPCPQLEADFLRLPKRVLDDKLALWKDIDLTIVTPSHWMAEQARASALFRGRRIEIIHNGLETDVFTPVNKSAARAALGIPDNALVLAFGAQSLRDTRKGVALLLEALQRACENLAFADAAWRGQVHLVTFGKENPEIRRLGLDITELGVVEDDDRLAAALSAADAVILPSLEDNYPNVMTEAMSCGTPVIGFDVGGVRDAVTHGERGYLISPAGDVGALTDIIVGLATRPQGRAELAAMGRAARAWIESTHNLRRFGETMLDLYRDLRPKTPSISSEFFADVVRATSNRDTRKTPYLMRECLDLGPGFMDPVVIADLRNEMNRIRASVSERVGLLVSEGATYPMHKGGAGVAGAALGISPPETNGSWTMSKLASLMLHAPEITGATRFSFSAFALAASGVAVEVFVNGSSLGKVNVANKPGVHTLTAPRDVFASSGKLDVAFHIPGAARQPNSSDPRDIGIKIQWFRFGADTAKASTGIAASTAGLATWGAPTLDAGTLVRFGRGAAASAYLVGDWKPLRTGVSLPINRHGSLVFRAPATDDAVTFTFEARVASVSGPGASKLTIFVDGALAGTVELPPSETMQVTVPLPREVSRHFRPKSVTLRLGDAEANPGPQLIVSSAQLTSEPGRTRRAASRPTAVAAPAPAMLPRDPLRRFPAEVADVLDWTTRYAADLLADRPLDSEDSVQALLCALPDLAAASEDAELVGRVSDAFAAMAGETTPLIFTRAHLQSVSAEAASLALPEAQPEAGTLLVSGKGAPALSATQNGAEGEPGARLPSVVASEASLIAFEIPARSAAGEPRNVAFGWGSSDDGLAGQGDAGKGDVGASIAWLNLVPAAVSMPSDSVAVEASARGGSTGVILPALPTPVFASLVMPSNGVTAGDSLPIVTLDGDAALMIDQKDQFVFLLPRPLRSGADLRIKFAEDFPNAGEGMTLTGRCPFPRPPASIVEGFKVGKAVRRSVHLPHGRFCRLDIDLERVTLGDLSASAVRFALVVYNGAPFLQIDPSKWLGNRGAGPSEARLYGRPGTGYDAAVQAMDERQRRLLLAVGRSLPGLLDRIDPGHAAFAALREQAWRLAGEVALWRGEAS